MVFSRQGNNTNASLPIIRVEVVNIYLAKLLKPEEEIEEIIIDLVDSGLLTSANQKVLNKFINDTLKKIEDGNLTSA